MAMHSRHLEFHEPAGPPNGLRLTKSLRILLPDNPRNGKSWSTHQMEAHLPLDRFHSPAPQACHLVPGNTVSMSYNFQRQLSVKAARPAASPVQWVCVCWSLCVEVVFQWRARWQHKNQQSLSTHTHTHPHTHTYSWPLNTRSVGHGKKLHRLRG